MKLSRKIQKKHVLITGAVIIMILPLSLLSAHFSANWAGNRLKAHDIAQTDREMTAACKTLTLLLESLHIQLSPQDAASCSPGDPSLYAHSCGTKAEITYADAQDILKDVDATADKLQILDAKLKDRGWAYYTNDFRGHGEHPLSTWANSLQSQGITISYRKGTCLFEVIMPATGDMYRGPYLGSLGCYIDSGPASI